jgi:hypothetical protein
MRVVHCRKERYTIFIGRGSVYGNPFTHLPLGSTKASVQVFTRDESVDYYERWLDGDPEFAAVDPKRREDILRCIPLLHEDDVLGCFCHPERCHGHVIVKIWYRIKQAKNERK